MVTCSDCGLPELKWGLTRGVLQAGTSAVTYGDGIYNLDVGANEQPDFISTQVVPPFYPIYCAVPDSNTAKTGYLALRGTPKEFYSCANLTPTFAPTDRKDIYWKVNPSNSTWPRGAYSPCHLSPAAMKLLLALQVVLAALSAGQEEDVSAYCTRTLPKGLSLSVVPSLSTASRAVPLKLTYHASAGSVSTMVTCSDCGFPTLIWYLSGGVLRAVDEAAVSSAAGAYNLPVEPNEQPDFITGRTSPSPSPIYCAVPDSAGASTGYLALRGTTKEFYSCENLTPTFAPTDRRDIYWRVDARNSTYPRGKCTGVGIRYKF
ncbi:hypothetical protein FRC17_002540 [Serendipita sp. 399]|nr:hypothetical protein FRC17_002540 [Serendipita sp. 399]